MIEAKISARRRAWSLGAVNSINLTTASAQNQRRLTFWQGLTAFAVAELVFVLATALIILIYLGWTYA